MLYCNSVASYRCQISAVQAAVPKRGGGGGGGGGGWGLYIPQ